MNLNDYKQKVFETRPGVKEEYDAMELQYAMIRLEIEARKKMGFTQKDLADHMGTTQSNISRFESGNYNPSVAFLQKMAASLGKTLKISFE